MTVSSTRELGQAVRRHRRALGLSQRDLALATGVGERFIVDLERGKETCQVGRVLKVLHGLRLALDVESTASTPSRSGMSDPGYDLGELER
jgi:y4mF family transcriptional regulator